MTLGVAGPSARLRDLAGLRHQHRGRHNGRLVAPLARCTGRFATRRQLDLAAFHGSERQGKGEVGAE